MRGVWWVGAFALVALAACDAVRYPGDGGEAPETPRERVDGEPPGPPPPTEPSVEPDTEARSDAPETPPSEPVDASPDEDPLPEAPVTPDPQPEAPAPQPDAPSPEAPDAGQTVPEAPNGDAASPESPEPGTPAPEAPEPDLPAPEAPPAEPAFTYIGAGQLIAGSGTGNLDQIVHAPDIVFPIRTDPAYLQSMVWNFGGGVAGGDQCDQRNFAYPWQDNFCETRSANRGTPFCPVNRIHQGQDIRVGTAGECRLLRSTDPNERMLHEVVAVEDGVVYEIGTFTVKLRAGGRIYRYMHLNMDRLQVEAGDSVQAGDVLGYVSNDFGGTPTTFHLHFEIIQNTAEHGWVHVPPYLSLVEAYERREAGPGERLAPVEVAASDILPIPEGLEIIE